MFAKIYEYENRPEILIKKDTNESEYPEVRVFFEIEGFGVCNTAFTFKDSDSGDRQRDKFFDKITKEMAIEMVEEIEDRMKN